MKQKEERLVVTSPAKVESETWVLKRQGWSVKQVQRLPSGAVLIRARKGNGA